MTFNPDMLIIARESRQMTQQELANKINISQVIISKIEAGINNPSEKFLENVAMVLDYPVEFFENDCYALDMGVRLHRKKSSLLKKEENYIDSIASKNNIYISKLLNFIDMDVNIPEIIIDDENTPEKIAEEVRYIWNMPKGYVRNLAKTLEHSGIIINEIEMHPKKFDGVSFYNKKYGFGFIVINKNQPPDRYRFTLAHELGHLIMHRNSLSAKREDEANSFASSFLMPAKDIKEDLKNLQFWNLPNLKSMWRVSMSALIHRAKDLELIDENKYKSLNVRLSQSGYRVNEPTMDIEKEEPTLLKDIILYLYNELNYNKTEMMKVLTINEYDYDEIFEKNKNKKIKSVNGNVRVVNFQQK